MAKKDLFATEVLKPICSKLVNTATNGVKFYHKIQALSGGKAQVLHRNLS